MMDCQQEGPSKPLGTLTANDREWIYEGSSVTDVADVIDHAKDRDLSPFVYDTTSHHPGDYRAPCVFYNHGADNRTVQLQRNPWRYDDIAFGESV